MMRTRRLLCAVVAAAGTMLSPAPAWADIRLTPFAGVTRIEDANNGTLGAALTLGGLLGLEVEAARTWLGSLEGVPVVDLDAHATTYMGNLVLRLPVGPIQPYATAGAGIVRVTGSVDLPVLGDVVSASGQDFAWNTGAGLYLLPAPNFGFRADIRRFQTGDISWEDFAGIRDLPLPKFNFWRATAGITFKF
jgi:opacity protein-like surface antigen